MKKGEIVLAAVIVFLILPLSAWASGYQSSGPFSPLSSKHIHYGVSQFSYGNVTGEGMVRLFNPGPVDQVAAMLVYSRNTEGDFTNPTELFIECRVQEVTSHGAWSTIFELDDLDGLLEFPRRRYVEVIWAPVEKVLVKRGYWRHQYTYTRIADGLGGGVSTNTYGGTSNTWLAHPKLFTLPNNIVDVAEAQQEAAIDCVCQGLVNQGLALDIFEEFGIYCPDEQPPP